MRVKEFFDLYDNWNGITAINDNELNCVAKGNTTDIVEREEFYNMIVVSFGFYDNELCISVRDESPSEKIQREISWNRLSELTTESIYGMFEAEPYEAAEFCRERDLSETEIDYLVSEEHRKYLDDEEDYYDDSYNYHDSYGI